MPIDLTTLRKLDARLAGAHALAVPEGERVVVIIKLRPGVGRPAYVAARAEISPQIFTAEVRAADLPRLEAEPGIESISAARSLASLG